MSGEDGKKFHEIASGKGWLLRDIAVRWGVTPRQLSRVANNPKVKDIDAVNGLPNKQAIRELNEHKK